MSYDGMAALMTTAHGHPAVRACLPVFFFWDVFADLGCPGGVICHYFFDK